MENIINLPEEVHALWTSAMALRAHFANTGLAFTLDGKLVGDIGEAVVAAAFGIELCTVRIPGIDGYAMDGRSVQIKATGRVNMGPAYTPGIGFADHLIFIRINFINNNAEILYNGPEAPVRALLPIGFNRTVSLNLFNVVNINDEFEFNQRLQRID